MQKSDDYLAVLLGHEICHIMVNDKMPNTTTAPEVEALCDLVGLTAAKGAGYDVSEKVADNNQAYAPKALAETYKKYNSSISEEEIEKQVNKVKEMYMPEKLNKIAEFVDKEIPSRSDFWVQHAQKKLDNRKKTSSPQSTTPERKPSSGNVTNPSLSQGVNR
jgi:hypothetical protein